MSVELITALAISGSIASIIASVVDVFVIRKFRKPETLEARIRKLSSALAESSRLVGEVESEISKRQALVSELQQDAERYQNLVSINREQVEAVAQLLQGELRKEGRKSFWAGVAVNFVFFSLGALLSWYLTA